MATGTLPIAGMLRQGALDHRSLPWVAELAARALERHPLRRLDLVVVVGGVPGDVVAEVEPDGLEHAHPPAPVPVLDLSELLDHPRDHPGLLAHLAQGGRLAALAGIRAALGQRPHPGPSGGGDDEDLAVADDAPAVGALELSRHTHAAPRGRERSAARGPD